MMVEFIKNLQLFTSQNTGINMAQESIDDFIQMAKDYAKAEKELGVQHWVLSVSSEKVNLVTGNVFTLTTCHVNCMNGENGLYGGGLQNFNASILKIPLTTI